MAFDEQEIKQSTLTDLYELLKQKIPGFKVINDYRENHGRPTPRFGKYRINMGGSDPVDITIDGVNLPVLTPRELMSPFTPAEALIEALREFKLSTVKGLEVIYSSKYTDQTVNGVPGYRDYYYAKIEITTVSGVGWYRKVEPDVVTYRPIPIFSPQQFYSPKYNVAPSSVVQPDYRSTIYWEPNITTNQNGKANVSFYTSDIKGAYTIKISGVDVTGGIGDGTFKLNQSKHENP